MRLRAVLALLLLVPAACGSGSTSRDATPSPEPGGDDSAATSDAGRPRFVFPVASEDTRYDPTHHDYPAADMFAECGTPVLAANDGTIEEVGTVDEWDRRTG